MKNYTAVPNIPRDKLSFWMERGLNLLLIGDHGIGKTSIIKNFWDSLGIKYAMFSGATLDPWTDLVGIPRPIEKNGEMFIEYVRPQTIPDDIEAIYIDEINRSHPKVRNALLELIQFKSINGRKFPKLRVVWAAANPSDTENNYDVEEMDPAQEDRFQVIVKLDYLMNFEYFEEKFGKRLADAAVSWWNKQDSEVKSLLSPRRMDYAVVHFLEGGDLRDILPYKEVNVFSLKRALSENRSLDEFKEIVKSRDEERAKKFLSDGKKWQDIYYDVINDFELADFSIKHLHPELVASTACSNSKFAMLLAHYQKTNKHLREVVKQIQDSGADHEWLSSALLAEKDFCLTKEITDIFDNVKESMLDQGSSVPKLTSRIGSSSVDDIIESINVGVSDPFPLFDTESACNVLEFLSKAWEMKALDNNYYENPNLPKLIGGAMYSLYKVSGNILPAVYSSSIKFVSNFAIPKVLSLSKVEIKNKGGRTFPTPIIPPVSRRQGRQSFKPTKL